MSPAVAHKRSMSQKKTYHQERHQHWEQNARTPPKFWLGAHYQRRLQRVYQHLVPPGARILELGCGTGDFLASLSPSHGLGVDFSREMILKATARHPHIQFAVADAHDFVAKQTFDYIVLSDLLNDLWDVQEVLQQIQSACHPRTRVIINTYSRLWQLPLSVGQQLGMAKRVLPQNWLTLQDVEDLLRITGFEMLRSWQEYLLPLPLPGVDTLFNRFLVRIWPFRHLALTNLVLARPQAVAPRPAPVVSVIVPARNEQGNIAAIFDRIPQMGARTELIFVEGHSTDQTYETIQSQIRRRGLDSGCVLQQSGVGKGDAVRLGLEHARGDILMILDADLTVPPEYLPRFYDALLSGTAEFVNGVRLVYPMDDDAMRFANILGNKAFAASFSWLLGQPVRDTLCGTKALWRADYERIAANRGYFGQLDPYGDFDLLLGAAKLGLRILDLPVRYERRVYGTTNIQRWSQGWLLLRMLLLAAQRLKFT